MSDVNVYEHEIPNGSKLYFAKSAKLKRKIEQKASEILEDEGFSEIVTPFFFVSSTSKRRCDKPSAL